MAMNKTELWNEVQELLVTHKASKKLTVALAELLEPKTSSSANPPKEIDGVMHYYCRFHQEYEAEEAMVMSGGKSKGYCRAGISHWNKTQAQCKKLQAKAFTAMEDGEFENAQALAQEAKDLNANIKYDIVKDWEAFNA